MRRSVPCDLLGWALAHGDASLVGIELHLRSHRQREIESLVASRKASEHGNAKRSEIILEDREDILLLVGLVALLVREVAQQNACNFRQLLRQFELRQIAI